MKIAQLAPLAESVPPKGYGGSELVVSVLTEELVKRGHEVTLFATADSFTSARLVTCAPEGLRRAKGIPSTRWVAYDLKSILRLEQMSAQFDVIHNHLGYVALPFMGNIASPTVTTIHNPIRDYCAEIFLACHQLPYVAISNAYRRLNYPEQLNYVATIHNGIDLDKFAYSDSTKKTYLLFLGRISSDKGSAEAIHIARELALPIVLAGKVDRNDREYFEHSIKPLLCHPQVEYIGEVSTEEKSRLYSDAIATLCPIKFDEPFGLVFAESLASGTPVMALNRGAAPEVISDGKTGIVGDTVDELIKRFAEIERINRKDCRERVKQLFSKERMTDQYESLYIELQSH